MRYNKDLKPFSDPMESENVSRALALHVQSRDREALKIKELEHVLIEKVEQVF
jgi:hypothetical protein